MGTQNKRNKHQKDRDRKIIAELLLRSYTYAQIAEHLRQITANEGYTISAMQVYYDAKKVMAEWREQRKEKINSVVEMELSKIDLMEFEAWQAWEQSKKGRSKTKTTGGTIQDGKIINVNEGGIERTIESSPGDPRYLIIIQNCWEKRKNLLGYGSAQKVEHSGTVGITIADLDADQMEKERARMLENMIKKRGISMN